MTSALPLEGTAGELRNRISGAVFTREDVRYDEHRRAWNLNYEHHPALIVVPESAADVAAAVSHAARWQLPVAIQATGHGVARPANGAMLVLMHRLTAVTVDRDAWTARLGGGAKWAHVMGPAISAGLAPLLGSTPDVGAVGYTLGGGMGWLARKYGVAADHVRSFDIVTADGHIRRTSPEVETELFWALRGGGAGSLGVVTAMEIDLVPVTSLYAGNLLYPAAMTHEVVAHYRQWIRSAPEELTSSICLMNFPATGDVPESLRRTSYAIVRGAFIGSDEDGEELLAHWRRWRTPELDLWARMPFSEIASVSNDPLDPTPAIVGTNWFDVISDDIVDILVAATFRQDGASPLLFAELRHAGGAVARSPQHAAAYGNRPREHLLEVLAVTPGVDDRRTAEELLSELRGRLEPHAAAGAYLNFLEGEERAARAYEGFDPQVRPRLAAVKTAYDPEKVFRHGIAIGEPSVSWAVSQ